MTRKLLAAMLLCLTLLGCGAATAAEAPKRLVPTKETENDTLRCLPLDGAECRFFVLGGELLLLEMKDENTCLLCFDGKKLTRKAQFTLGAGDWQIWPDRNAICCWREESREVILLDADLQETERLALPPETRGVPVLDSGARKLYYCTDSALMVLELDSGIHCTLRETGSAGSSAVRLTADGILCTWTGESLFLSPEDGRKLGSAPPVGDAAVFGSQTVYAVRCGENDCLYLGSTMLPLPPGWRFCAFLPERHSALLYHEGELAIYDLSTGSRTAQIKVDTSGEICAAGCGDGMIYFQTDRYGYLFQWMPEYNPIRDSALQISPLYTRDFPDEKGLAQCRQRARFIEEQYGVTILLNTDALRIQPGEYRIEPEHLPAMVMDALNRIEKMLNRFPTDFIRQVTHGAPRTFLCPVRSIRQNGTELRQVQYWSGSDSYLFIAITEDAGESAIRALERMMDDRILSCSNALDGWEALNPAGFRYGADTAGDTASFADESSTESPAEDRAGILLSAMNSGNRELYCSAILQSKLRALCTGLREAYNLSGALPWEQYLW